jgi:hypothetical protein
VTITGGESEEFDIAPQKTQFNLGEVRLSKVKINQTEHTLLLGRAELHLLGEADLAINVGTAAHCARVDCTGNAVTLLHVQLGKGKALVVHSGVFGNVASRRLVKHVANNKAANSLVLWGETPAVEAVHGGRTSTGARGLGTTMVAALCRHRA